MIDIFTEYAQVAFRTEEGLSNPPKPDKTLEQLLSIPHLGPFVEKAIEHFIWCHKVPTQQVSEAREQFQKLYDSGVFAFHMALKGPTLSMDLWFQLLVWNGKEYVDVNEVLKEIIPKEVEDDCSFEDSEY